MLADRPGSPPIEEHQEQNANGDLPVATLPPQDGGAPTTETASDNEDQRFSRRSGLIAAVSGVAGAFLGGGAVKVRTGGETTKEKKSAESVLLPTHEAPRVFVEGTLPERIGSPTLVGWNLIFDPALTKAVTEPVVIMMPGRLTSPTITLRPGEEPQYEGYFVKGEDGRLAVNVLAAATAQNDSFLVYSNPDADGGSNTKPEPLLLQPRVYTNGRLSEQNMPTIRSEEPVTSEQFRFIEGMYSLFAPFVIQRGDVVLHSANRYDPNNDLAYFDLEPGQIHANVDLVNKPDMGSEATYLLWKAFASSVFLPQRTYRATQEGANALYALNAEINRLPAGNGVNSALSLSTYHGLKPPEITPERYEARFSDVLTILRYHPDDLIAKAGSLQPADKATIFNVIKAAEQILLDAAKDKGDKEVVPVNAIAALLPRLQDVKTQLG